MARLQAGLEVEEVGGGGQLAQGGGNGAAGGGRRAARGEVVLKDGEEGVARLRAAPYRRQPAMRWV